MEARDIDFAYPGGSLVLRAVSLTVEPRRVTALVGPNGGGKSTMLRLLGGLMRPTRGCVSLGGRDVASMAARERARDIAYIAQRSAVAFGYRAADVLGFSTLSAGADSRAAAECRSRLGVEDLTGRVFEELSAGQQQRVHAARALTQLARRDGGRVRFSGTLLADEPAASMDMAAGLVTLGALRDASREGLAVCVVLHDLSLARRFADDVLLLSGTGEARARGAADAVLESPLVDEVFGVRMEWTRSPSGIPAAVHSPPVQPTVPGS